MITVKTRNGHTIRCIISLDKLDDIEGGHVFGAAECVGCGMIATVGCGTSHEGESEESLDTHRIQHLRQTVELFEEQEACLQDFREDEIIDWAQMMAPPS